MRRQQTETELFTSTAKAREMCVRHLTKLAERFGARLEFHEFNGPREIGLELIKGPFQCMIHLDGSERINAFLGHWHTALHSNAKFPKDFGTVIRGSLNEYHYDKATTCEETWNGFVRSLEAGLNALKG